MGKNKIQISLVFLIIALVLAMFIFNNKESRVLDSADVYLSWVHQSEFAGSYVAKEKGFYKKEGLEVNIIPFDFESSPADLVIKEGVNFGIMSADQFIISKGKGYPIKAIAAIYKNNPAVMYSLKEKNIIRPQDFIGKKIGLEKGSSSSYLYKAMMNNLKINRNDIEELEIGHGIDEILTGIVDVSTGYVINEPNLAEEYGKEVNVILMSDYGVRLYGDIIFTKEDLINNNPNLVKRFLRATLDGWQYAIENQEEASVVVMEYSKDSTQEHQYKMLKDSIPLINDGISFLGWMDKDQWQRSYDILRNQKVVQESIDVTNLYTVEFLADYYINKKK
jgi:ABC-type nitrate/sulfonate/bicarbonate transport system substrate-binding protein